MSNAISLSVLHGNEITSFSETFFRPERHNLSMLEHCVCLAALTFDKKGSLPVPEASKTQTVTFQATVNLRPLRCMPLLSGESKSFLFDPKICFCPVG